MKQSDLEDFLGSADDPPSKRGVMRAALTLFVKDGLCATSLRDIAQETGYSSPALYKFFPSKNHLALYLFERCYRPLVAAFQGAVAPERPFQENFDALMQAVRAIIERDPEIILYVNEHVRLLWPLVSAETKRFPLVFLMRDFLAQGVREGLIGPESDIPYLSAILLGALAQYTRLFYFGEFKGPPGETLSKLARILWRLFEGGAS